MEVCFINITETHVSGGQCLHDRCL